MAILDSPPSLSGDDDQRNAELEADNEAGFDEVLKLRDELEAMTNARDLCKRQTAEAHQQHDRTKERLEKTQEAWEHEKQRGDTAQDELDRERRRQGLGSSATAVALSGDGGSSDPLTDAMCGLTTYEVGNSGDVEERGEEGLQRAWEASGGAGAMPGLQGTTVRLEQDELQALLRPPYENTYNGERADAYLRAKDKLKAASTQPNPEPHLSPGSNEPWRVGTKLGRTIYRQVGPEPSEQDVLLGMMESAELAGRVVCLHNQPHLSGDGERLQGLERELRKLAAQTPIPSSPIDEGRAAGLEEAANRVRDLATRLSPESSSGVEEGGHRA